MKRLVENNPSIWLVDAVDLIGIQKINSLPACDPMRQIGRICVAMGMGRVRLMSVCVMIRGIETIGCMVSCNGFDIVPFVTGIYASKSFSSDELDLESVYSSIGNHNDKIYH